MSNLFSFLPRINRLYKREISGPIDAPDIEGFTKSSANQYLIPALIKTYNNISINDCKNQCLLNKNCSYFMIDQDLIGERNADIKDYKTSFCHLFNNVNSGNMSIPVNYSYNKYTYNGYSSDDSLTNPNKYLKLLLDTNRPFTMCRGTGWNDNNGPVSLGYQSPDTCAQECAKDSSCTSFDISNPDINGNYNCFLFKHNDKNNVQGVLGDFNNYGCYKKIFDINAYTNRMYTSNNWMVYQGTSGTRNQTWKSGLFLLTDNINNAAQVSKIPGDTGYNKGDLVSMIFDIGSWNFESVDLYIKLDYISSSVQPTLSPQSLFNYFNDNVYIGDYIDANNNVIPQYSYKDRSTLYKTSVSNGIMSDFPILCIGTHNIWTNPPPVFNYTGSTNLPPYNIGLSYVSSPFFVEKQYAYPSNNTNSGIYPLSTIKTKYPTINKFSSSTYVINNNSRIFKINIKSSDLTEEDKKRYLVISHSGKLQSSVVDLVFNKPNVTNIPSSTLFQPINVNGSSSFYYPQWKQVGGSLKQVEIDGNVACGTNTNDDIWCADNDLTNPQWKYVPGKLKQVTVNNGKLYGVNSSNMIYTADYNPDTSKIQWKQVGGSLKQTEIDSNVVCGTDANNNIWCADNNIYSSPNFYKLPGSLKQVSLNQGKLYGVNSSGNIYKSDNYSNPNWVQVPGSLKQVDLNNNVACGVNDNNNVYCIDESSDYKTLQQIPGNLKQVSVNSNRRLYGIDNNNNIYTTLI